MSSGLLERSTTSGSPDLSDQQLAHLRTRFVELAEVVDSDRALAGMRRGNVIDLGAVLLRRERVRAAEQRWGHQLRGNGASSA